VSHRRHQILDPRPARRSERVSGVPKIMNVQTLRADRPHRVPPGGHLVEVAAPQRPALGPGKTSAPGSGLTKIDRCSHRAGMMARGMPTTRRPALDFGGPSRISRLTAPRTRRGLGPCPHPGPDQSAAAPLPRPSGGWRKWPGAPGHGTADHGCSRLGHRRPSSRVPVRPRLWCRRPPESSASPHAARKRSR
jgi:hypothetical protein